MKKALITDLEKIAVGAAHLYVLEEDPEKKEQLDQILQGVLRMIENLKSLDERDDDDPGEKESLLDSIWTEVAKNFIEYGLGELFERLLDFGIMTYNLKN